MTEEQRIGSEDLQPAEACEDPRQAPKKTPIITRGTLQYYIVFLSIVLAILSLGLALMMPFRTLLSQYETAQPQQTAEKVFELLFEDPDWALLYDMAKVQGTEFEGRSAYVTYMENKVGDRKLHYLEVSNGLSKDKRYSVRLGQEEIASFTTYSYDDGVSTFPLWTLGEVALYFERTESVTVTKMPGYTVYVNGVPLDESYTVVYVDTLAENYLPGDLDGYHYVQQHIGGFLVQPDVVVVDENNKPLPLTQDPITGIYSTDIPVSPEMTGEEHQLILNAVQAELLFSIRKISASELRHYFQANAPAYNALNEKPAAAENWASYAFDAGSAELSDFYRYDPYTFSVRVKAELEVVLADGNVQIIPLETTYIFSENGAGTYLVTESVDADLQKVITSVLIEFECDGESVGNFVTDVKNPAPVAPMLEDRPNAPFLGWGRMGADGKLTLVLQAVANGQFQVVAGEKLTYGTLYPVYGGESN